MLTIFFTGTGNTMQIADLFSAKMEISAYSIEDDIDFSEILEEHDTIAVCYPIYGSRVPYIMREFIAAHMSYFYGKRLVILVTQLIFSGDGARALCDLFPPNHVEVVYAEHFNMPNNVCNVSIVPKTSPAAVNRKLRAAGRRMDKACWDIKLGKVKRRGFNPISRILGIFQGFLWQGSSRRVEPPYWSVEYKARRGVRVDEDCTLCGFCVKFCPMKNLRIIEDRVIHNNNCTVCYRCVNLCPVQAITVYFHKKPVWQYKGIDAN